MRFSKFVSAALSALGAAVIMAGCSGDSNTNTQGVTTPSTPSSTTASTPTTPTTPSTPTTPPSPSCLFSVSPTSFSVGSASGTGVVSVVASSTSCQWTTASNASFLTVAPANGTGSANAIVAYSQDTGADRTGTVTVAGQTVTVNQVGSILESFSLRLDGNSAFTISSPELPALSNTCYYVPNPATGQITSCLLIVAHGTYHFNSDVPLTVATGCDSVSADRRSCTVNVTGPRGVVHFSAS